jgi:lysyl endopeptidase
MTRKLLAALAFTIPAVASATTTPATQRVYEAATEARHMPSQAFAPTPAAAIAWRAPALVPVDLVSMPPVVQQKSSAAITSRIGQPLQVGTNQPLAKAASIVQWTAVAGGFVAKIRVSSEGAVGLRVRLDLGTVPGAFTLVAQGSGDPRLEAMTIDPTLGNSHWTPWTDGASQVIELFSPVMPSPTAVNVAVVANFTESPLQTKAGSASCTVPASCTTGDSVLDGAIAQRVKSNVKLLFTKGSGQFLCTGTLINSPLAPAPFIVTANHCINTVDEAAATATFWFYETQSCTELTTAPGLTQVSGGTQLVFTNFMVDSTLLRMNQPVPGGAVFSGWSAVKVPDGSAIVSVSHPAGDSSRIALGTVSQEFRVPDWPYDMYGIKFTSGIIEGGSSGSGLFTLNNGSLDLRGVLTGSTVTNGTDGLSCTDLNEYALYDRFEVFEPEIDQYISGNIRTDDAPNRVQDFTGVAVTDPPIDQKAKVYPNMQINYPGDVDVFRFTLVAPVSNVHIYATGGLDTVGVLMDSTGTEIDANDDESSASTDFGITHSLQAGTYFVGVGHWVPTAVGTYTLNITTTTSTPAATVNYTDLWWNSPANSESGWGLNLNHQGDIMFATLFTYDASGNPLWLVMSNGAKQADGSFTGTIYTTTADAFNASPWNAAHTSATSVGTMTLAFPDANTGTLTYTYNGTTVTKHIIRENFSTPVTCTFVTTDRSTLTNYQDLWWNPNESGWGINITHQGDIIFATLFDYDATGHATWWVLANGAKTGTGNYSGDLYTVKGPVFNASPWSATMATKVGTMSLQFASGTTGTLTYSVNGVTVTKQIQRQVFSSPNTKCQ